METFVTRRSTLVLASLAFIVFGLILSLALVRTRQEIRQKAAPGTTLELLPATQTVNQGDQFNVDVQIHTGSNSVYQADVVVTYDAQVFDGVRFENGTFMAAGGTGGILEGGSGHLTLSVPTTGAVSGDGLLGRLVFKAHNAASQSTIAIDGSSTILAVGENGNVITSSQGATVAVTQTIIPDSSLSFSGNATQTVGNSFDMYVALDTGVNHDTVADLIVKYDPTRVTVTSIDPVSTAGSLMPIRALLGTVGGGTAHIQVSSANDTDANGTGNIAKLTLSTLVAGTTKLTFDPATYISGVGTDTNLVKTPLGEVTITSSGIIQPTPTPTPVATPVPSSSPDATPNSSPQPTPSTTSCTSPTIPTGLTASALNASQIQLSWSTDSNTTHYGIVYGLVSGTYLYGADNIGNVSSYTVSGLGASTNYYFAIYSNNDCGSSGYSTAASAQTLSTSGGGIGGTILATPPSNNIVYTPSPVPSPAIGFHQLGPQPVPSALADNPFFGGNAGSSGQSSNLPKVSVPPEFGQQSGKNSLLTPLGGIFLIISALFVGIFFWKMRG